MGQSVSSLLILSFFFFEKLVQIVKIHPGSTLCDKKVPAIIYNDLVSVIWGHLHFLIFAFFSSQMYTNQIYAHGVSFIPKSFFLTLNTFKQQQA